MKFCFLSTGFYPEDGGGIGTYIRNLASGLKELGHDVCVVAQTQKYDLQETIDGINVFRRRFRYLPKIERFFPYLRWSQYLSSEIEKIDKEFDFDVVEFPNWEGTGFWYVGKGKRKRVVTRVHTPYFETLMLDKRREDIAWMDKYLCWQEKQACLKSDLIISSTKLHREMISKEYGISEKMIKILPLGIKLDFETAINKEDEIEVLYVSRLEHRKGSMVLLEAIPQILEKYTHVRFAIAGKDRNHAPGGITHKEYFFNKYGEYQNKVNFLGFLSEEELREKYMKCDIFAVPSIYESFGLIYVEAMMHAKPVIGCMSGGIPEVVEHGVSGLLVEPNSVDEFVKALIDLIENKEKRKKLGDSGQRICKEKFDYKIMARRVEDIYFK